MTCVIMDGANSYVSLQLIRKKIDFAGLRKYFGATSIHYYTATYEDENGLDQMRKYTDWMSYNGVIMHQKPVKIIMNKNERTMKGNMDVEIAVDAVALSPCYERFVFFTGDGDFAYLYHKLRMNGKHITVVSTMNCAEGLSNDCNCVSDLARRNCDGFINMNDPKGFGTNFLVNA